MVMYVLSTTLLALATFWLGILIGRGTVRSGPESPQEVRDRKIRILRQSAFSLLAASVQRDLAGYSCTAREMEARANRMLEEAERLSKQVPPNCEPGQLFLVKEK